MVAGTSEFSGYEPTTNDPGWIVTVAVVAFNILISASLPLLLWCNHKFWKRWSAKDAREQQIQGANTGTTEDSEEEFSNAHGSSPLKKYPLSRNHISQCHSQGTGIRSNAASTVNSLTFRRSPGSVISEGYVSIAEHSTVSQQIAKNVLNVRAHKIKRHVPKGLPSPNIDFNVNPIAVADPDSQHMGDEHSEAMSAMSTLDNDAVSARDAVDANDKYFGDDEQDTSRFHRLLEIADWDQEMKEIWSLTIPYSIQGIFYGVFSSIDVALIGHFLGTTEANAYITVSILIEFTTTFTYGFTEAVGTLCPQAHGAGNHVLMGRYLQLGIIFYLLGTIPGVIIWSFLTERAVLWFGFDQQTAEMAQRYAFPYLTMTVIGGIDSNLLEYFNVTDHEKYCTIYYIVGHIISTLALLLTALLGWDDLVLIGIVQTILTIVFLVGNFACGWYMGWLDPCWEGLALTFSLRDRRAVHTMMITAIPLGISWLLTYGEWEVMTIFAGFMGPAEVAAWGLIGYVWSTFEQLTEGLSSAAETRVAFRIGAGQPGVAKLCAYKGVYAGVVVSGFATAMLFILAPYLPGWITPDPTLQRMIFDLIPLIGFSQFSMSVGSVCWSIIGAQGRMQLATMIEVITSWGLAIPISAVLTFVFNWNLLGPCSALLISYAVGGVATGFLVITSDWDAISKRVISYSAMAGVNYDDYDWADLPDHIQEAAETLGYNKKTWNTSGDTETSNLAWAELSLRQKEAASLMGYTQKKWDGDSNSDSGNGNEEDGEGNGNENEVHALEIDSISWDRLPPAAQRAASVLGIDKDMWDADEEPESSSKYWSELTPSERKSAMLLGYDKKRWNIACEANSDES